MQALVAIAFGGAFGALMRHFVSGGVSKLAGIGFPLGTFTVNIVGSLLMGFLITAFAHKMTVTPGMREFLAVGFLGSFTTFSTYSMETVLLVERGEWLSAAVYAGGSLIVGVLALLAGMWMGRFLA